MSSTPNLIPRTLAIAHALVGLAIAALTLLAFVWPMARASYSFSALLFMGPPTALGLALAVWFVVVAGRVWFERPGAAKQLRLTDAGLLLIAVLLVLLGRFWIGAATESAAHGGGLLGGLGYLPLAAGVALGGFALVALLLSFGLSRPPGR